jgi:hypothetical protein
MTEQEWLDGIDPEPMLKTLGRKASDRKLRLFTSACCRRVWHLLADARSRTAVEVMERYADGAASEEERQAAQKAAQAVWDPGEEHEADLDNAPAWAADMLVRGEIIGDQWVFRGEAWASIVTESAQAGAARGVENQAQTLLLRDIFGNPFRRASVKPAWQTPSVVSLAQAAYEERILPAGTLDPTRLAVLSDALEEVGCSNAQLLEHCRGPGPHVRGCWALDLILGKS